MFESDPTIPLIKQTIGSCHLTRQRSFRAVAVLLSLASTCTLPSTAQALEPPVERVADEAIQSVANLLLKDSSIATEKPATNHVDLSFTVLEGGIIPRIPTCGQSLHTQFNGQMGKLGSAIGIGVNLDAAPDQATVNVAVGDTRQLMEPVTRPNPFETQWKKTEARLGGAARSRGVNLGLYDVFSVNWVKGFYSRVSGRFLYGHIWIHWWGVNLDEIDGVEQCQVNFVEHVLWLFIADLQARFREQLYAMKVEWIGRAGIDPARDHAASHQVERLMLASLMCAQFLPITESSSFALCSRQLTDLITGIPR
jgi:hypothetical protein